MPDNLYKLVDYLPFIGMITGQPKHSPVIVRLIEAAIIGGVLLYGTVQMLGKDIDWLKQEMMILQSDVKELTKEVYLGGKK